MLTEIYPRVHARYSSLAVLGPHLDGFVAWLRSQGYPLHPIHLRVRATRRLDGLLRRRGVRQPSELTAEEFLAFAPKDSQDDIDLAATVHSLVRYFDAEHVLAPTPFTPRHELVLAYRTYLTDARLFAASTATHHADTVTEWLAHAGFTHGLDGLRTLDPRAIEDFLVVMGGRVCRQSLQHTVAHLRAFLRYLASRGLARPVSTPGSIHRASTAASCCRAPCRGRPSARSCGASTSPRPWGAATTRCSCSRRPTACAPARSSPSRSTTSRDARGSSACLAPRCARR